MTVDFNQSISTEKRTSLLQQASDLLDDGRTNDAAEILHRLGLPTNSMPETISRELKSVLATNNTRSDQSQDDMAHRSFPKIGISRVAGLELREDYLTDLSSRFPGLLAKLLIRANKAIRSVDEEAGGPFVIEDVVETKSLIAVTGLHLYKDDKGRPECVELIILKNFKPSRSFARIECNGSYYNSFGVILSFYDPFLNSPKAEYFFSPRLFARDIGKSDAQNPAPTTFAGLITDRIVALLCKEKEFQDDAGMLSPECLSPEYERIKRIATKLYKHLRNNEDSREDSIGEVKIKDPLLEEFGFPLAYASGRKDLWNRVIRQISPANLLTELSQSSFLQDFRSGFEHNDLSLEFSGFFQIDSSPRIWLAGFRGKS